METQCKDVNILNSLWCFSVIYKTSPKHSFQSYCERIWRKKHLSRVFYFPSMIKSLRWVFLVPKIQLTKQPAQLPCKQQPLLYIKTNTKPNYKHIVIGTLSSSFWCSDKISIHSWQNIFPPVCKMGLMGTARMLRLSAAFILCRTSKLTASEILKSADIVVFFLKGNVYVGALTLLLHPPAQIKN